MAMRLRGLDAIIRGDQNEAQIDAKHVLRAVHASNVEHDATS